ncbi:hypothetical protein Slin15195_G091690 [Septoria linicola]|uniref:Uncharacterized protein n=1 Tax=Septoria linicola TaxID=215465 RepID=A0A9Q9AVE8_9PEZI|nr:hypothetical protein Slin15195_G091690 [Septoria linicola]
MTSTSRSLQQSACYRFHQLDYEQCPTDELQQFLGAKTRMKVRKNVEKTSLIKRLQEYDERATFSFGDLPAELRLLVYENLAFHPQILATCKNYCKEAKPVLEKAATIIEVTGQKSPPRIDLPAPPPAVFIPGFPISEQWTNTAISAFKVGSNGLLLATRTEERLLEMFKQLELLRKDKLKLTITGANASAINRALYLLATILDRSHRIEVQVNIELVGSMVSRAYKWVARSLFPLTKMGPGTFVTINECPKRLRKLLETALSDTKEKITVLFQGMQLEREVLEEMNLLRRAGVSAMAHYSVLHWLRLTQLGPADADEYYTGSREGTYMGNPQVRRGLFNKPELRALREKALRILAERVHDEQGG